MDKKKKLIIEIIVFILLLIGITVTYNLLINNKNNFKEESKMEIIEIEGVEQFEKEVINGGGTVFVDFYATWCMPCKMMSSVIDEIAKEHKDVKFVKINVDNNQELSIRYNVMNIPTMLIIKNREVTKTFVGITDKEEIVAGL